MIDTVALREKVLDLAIRGKLVPQDPNDEPASVLLERIREQKRQMVREGKLKAKDIKDDSIIYVGEDNLHYEKFADGTEKCIEDEIPFELPQGWAWVRLQAICEKEIKRGKAPKYVEKSGTLVFAQKCNTKKGHINLSLAQYLDESTLHKYPVDLYTRYNDIIINSTGTGTLGRIGIFQESDDTMQLPIVPDSHITTVRAFSDNVAKYVYLFLKAYQCYFENAGEGSTNQKELRPEVIKAFLIAIPPYFEQKRIVEKFEKTCNFIDLLDTHTDDFSNTIKSIKLKILDLAVRGKLVPQDPSDEPASALLERIRAEKEELIKQGKIKRDKKESIIFKGEDNSYYEKYGEILPKGWVVTNLETLLSYEQPTDYIVNTTDYNDSYSTPVLTAGKSFFLGYTNETTGIYNQVPTIIFDDFTTESKYVDFPFKVKSSAMKILTANTDLILIRFAYYLMQSINIDHDNHQRYWISVFSKQEVALPPLAEQQRIIDTIDYYFDLLDSAVK